MRPLALLALALALLAAPSGADVLVPRSGKPVRGVLVSRTEGEVVFNPYWSDHPEMVWEVLRLPSDKVKRIEVEPRPEPEVWRRLRARSKGDTQALLEIAHFALEHKLKAHAEMCFALALGEDGGNAQALERLGGTRGWERVRRGHPALDPDLASALGRYANEADPKAREATQQEILERGFDAKPHELERYRRAALTPRGYVADQPVTLRSDVHVGATYALFVPSSYDPTVPWPLILGLHGGGPDGKAGDEVVGSGPSAMNFYRDLAQERGFLVACPTALVAGWSDPRNEAFVRDVLREMTWLYHVDVDRVYLTGHSMGGFGTWALGPRMAAELAAISPMAGAGGGGLAALIEHRTAIFIYHSADDFIDPGPDREAARRLRDTDHDFQYTELPHEGHGFPRSVAVQLFDYFGTRRRQDPAWKEAWPHSSFLGKVSKDEERYLGDPLAERQGRALGVEDLVLRLRLGGGGAALAVAQLAQIRPAGAADLVAKVFRDAKASPDARAWAARALGLLGDPLEVAGLRRTVAAPAAREGSRMVVEAARALVLLGDREAAKSLATALEAWTTYYEDKVMGSAVRISDFERALFTLAEVVTAWGTLAEDGRSDLLARTVVARVLAPQHVVETSDRVPQDPSLARTALATATAKAYAARGAGADLWDDLASALGNDERARGAALALRP